MMTDNFTRYREADIELGAQLREMRLCIAAAERELKRPNPLGQGSLRSKYRYTNARGHILAAVEIFGSRTLDILSDKINAS